MLPLKIKEQKNEILSVKNEYSINKFKYHIKEFDIDLYDEIFGDTRIEISINDSIGK